MDKGITYTEFTGFYWTQFYNQQFNIFIVKLRIGLVGLLDYTQFPLQEPQLHEYEG